MDLARYIGIPFVEKGRSYTGVDCWGIVWLIYREVFGIYLESHAEEYTTTHDHLLMAALMKNEVIKSGWNKILPSEVQTGDVLEIRILGRPWHCGLVVDPPCFIHADRHAGTVMARWDGLLWARRLDAIYRHPARLQSGARTLEPVR